VKEGELDVTWWGIKAKQFINLKPNPLKGGGDYVKRDES
jgi:hypothetical protein